MKPLKHLTLNKEPEKPICSIDNESPMGWDHLGKNLKEFWDGLFDETVE